MSLTSYIRYSAILGGAGGGVGYGSTSHLKQAISFESASRTLGIADNGKTLIITGDLTFTIPPHSSVRIPENWWCNFVVSEGSALQLTTPDAATVNIVGPSRCHYTEQLYVVCTGAGEVSTFRTFSSRGILPFKTVTTSRGLNSSDLFQTLLINSPVVLQIPQQVVSGWQMEDYFDYIVGPSGSVTFTTEGTSFWYGNTSADANAAGRIILTAEGNPYTINSIGGTSTLPANFIIGPFNPALRGYRMTPILTETYKLQGLDLMIDSGEALINLLNGVTPIVQNINIADTQGVTVDLDATVTVGDYLVLEVMPPTSCTGLRAFVRGTVRR